MQKKFENFQVVYIFGSLKKTLNVQYFQKILNLQYFRKIFKFAIHSKIAEYFIFKEFFQFVNIIF
jgi:hypothetical protein